MAPPHLAVPGGDVLESGDARERAGMRERSTPLTVLQACQDCYTLDLFIFLPPAISTIDCNLTHKQLSQQLWTQSVPVCLKLNLSPLSSLAARHHLPAEHTETDQRGSSFPE